MTTMFGKFASAAFDAMDPGTLFVDHTTASAFVAREMASAGSEKSIGFIDAPVSGGQAGAGKRPAYDHVVGRRMIINARSQ